MLLGVKAVIAESFERIHRSNLIGMGVLPCQFVDGQNAQTLGLTGREIFDLGDLQNAEARTVAVTATPESGGKPVVFQVRVRIDTPKERDYYRHGGILQYVLRQLAGADQPQRKAQKKAPVKPKAKSKLKPNPRPSRRRARSPLARSLLARSLLARSLLARRRRARLCVASRHGAASNPRGSRLTWTTSNIHASRYHAWFSLTSTARSAVETR
jgi:hypothetical protein